LTPTAEEMDKVLEAKYKGLGEGGNYDYMDLSLTRERERESNLFNTKRKDSILSGKKQS